MSTLEKTDLIRKPDAQPTAFKHLTHDNKPSDPMEHFNKHQCAKGHGKWDKDRVIYSQDHRAYILHCVPCDDDYILPTGGIVPIPAPAGLSDKP